VRAIVVAMVLAGCEGQISAPGASPGGDPITPPTPPVPLSNGRPSFGPTEAYQLRRLTTDQYVSSVTTLLGVSSSGMPPIEPVPPVFGYVAIGASSVVVSNGGVSQFEDAARFFAHTALATAAGRQRMVPCTPSSVADTTCFRAFVSAFGPRVFRRPLATDEIDRYVMLTGTVATASADPWAGLEATLSAFLQSPNFLYLAEVGEADPTRPGQYRFTAYEMASRLSYFLLGDTPDDTLLASAASGALATPDGVRAEAERLVALPAARTAVRRFVAALLSLDLLDGLTRPVQVFPKFTSTLGAALKEQALRTFEDLVFDRDASYRELFDQSATFVNDELAAFYGLPAVGGAAFSRVTLPGTDRVGLLGQAGVLAVHDHPDGTSPTKRGLFVLTRLLCQGLALAPPAGLTIPPAPTGNLTARQRLEQHATNPVCASCHKQMDSVGLSLERFDALGVPRDTDHGQPIDDHGQLGPDTYSGEPGLAALLRTEPASTACLVQALYGTGVGHLPTEFDRASFDTIADGFDAGGAKIRALLTSIASSDAFRSAPPP
jgi:hypothetical protein